MYFRYIKIQQNPQTIFVLPIILNILRVHFFLFFFLVRENSRCDYRNRKMHETLLFTQAHFAHILKSQSGFILNIPTSGLKAKIFRVRFLFDIKIGLCMLLFLLY